MPNVMLIMQRKSIAQGFMDRLRDSPDIRLIYESNYRNADIAIRSNNAKAALIEATESGPYGMSYCLMLCERLRKQTPDCKLIMMCPEQDEQSVKQVIIAKGKKQIDDFVFYDVSNEYLASKLISI